MQENIEIKAERIREIVKSENIRNIYLKFIDLNGNILRKKSISTLSYFEYRYIACTSSEIKD